jgi:uncharacterized protein
VNNSKVCVALAGIVLALASPEHSAQAASFDCSTAKTQRELTICHDPDLSALDDKLGKLYNERRALLSATGAASLRQSQLSWLRFIALTCAELATPRPGGLDAASCLQKDYTERLGQLAEVGKQIGPFRFNRVDHFDAKPAETGDDSGSSPGFYIQHVAYPQIDDPTTAAQRTWNKKNSDTKPAGYCDSEGDDDTDYEIGFAHAHFISVQWGISSYCHGTPHGLGNSSTDNELLVPTLHPLSARGVFGDSDLWIGPLKKLIWDALLANNWTPPPEQAASVKGQIETDAITPEKWFFTKDGLTFTPEAYEGGCYACYPGEAKLSWKQLRPLLPPQSVVLR